MKKSKLNPAVLVIIIIILGWFIGYRIAKSQTQWQMLWSPETGTITIKDDSGKESQIVFADSVYFNGDMPVSKSAELFLDAVNKIHKEKEKQLFNEMAERLNILNQYSTYVNEMYMNAVHALVEGKKIAGETDENK